MVQLSYTGISPIPSELDSRISSLIGVSLALETTKGHMELGLASREDDLTPRSSKHPTFLLRALSCEVGHYHVIFAIHEFQSLVVDCGTISPPQIDTGLCRRSLLLFNTWGHKSDTLDHWNRKICST